MILKTTQGIVHDLLTENKLHEANTVMYLFMKAYQINEMVLPDFLELTKERMCCICPYDKISLDFMGV